MKKMKEFLEADRERLLTGLKNARTPEAAQTVLEKEADRLLLQFNEDCGSARVRDAASGMMQAVRGSVPFVDCAGEPRVWRSGSGAAGGFAEKTGKTSSKAAGLSGILLGLGAALTLAAFFAPALLTGGMKALPSLMGGILLPLAGGACLYLAGRAAGKKARIRLGSSGEDGGLQERIEMTVDPEKLWNSLRGAILVVDRNLAAVQETEDYDRAKELAAASGAKGISAEEVELFSGLLELAHPAASGQTDPGSFAGKNPGQSGRAYEGSPAVDGTSFSQMEEDIRYYLHKKNVEVVEWSEKNSSWFETLPGLSGGSAKGYTIRPALAQSGRLLKKGLAVR